MAEPLTDRAGLEAQIAGLAARMDNFEQWMHRISDAVSHKTEKNFAPVYIGMIAAVSTLIALGTFALTPVRADIARMERAIEKINDHDSDGHPEAVLALIERIDVSSSKDRELMAAAIIRDEERMDSVEQSLGVLETIAEERTNRFIRIVETLEAAIDTKAEDRWTGDQQSLYQAMHRRVHDLERQERSLRGPGRGLGQTLKDK